MGQYLLRRLVISVPVLLGITIATYAIINFAPGDPVSALINPETAAALGPGWVQQQREQGRWFAPGELDPTARGPRTHLRRHP